MADDPFFVSSALTRHREAAGTTPARQAAALGLGLRQLALLALCRSPRPGADRAVDLEQIAAYAGLRVEVLDEIIGPEPGPAQPAGPASESPVEAGAFRLRAGLRQADFRGVGESVWIENEPAAAVFERLRQ